MASFFMYAVKRVLLFLGALLGRLFLRVKIVGQENLPESRSLILISNHFSWFDAPLLTVFLPLQPTFLIATESQRRWMVRAFMKIFDGIPIWRGQVDRRALRRALSVLNQGGVLGVFPEGGIDPKVAQEVQRGEVIDNFYDHVSRQNAELVQARPGVALLAVESQAHILPIALIGTEQILQNIIRFRRTDITIHIGQTFGPFSIDPSLEGRDKRKRLDVLADTIMQRVAILFPPEKRGPYRRRRLKSVKSI